MRFFDRRKFLTHSAALPVLATLADASSGDAWRGTSRRKSRTLITAETQSAIDAGLSFLDRQQLTEGNNRGAFGNRQYPANTAVVGLAGMAFMSSGSTPNRGPYGANISACIDYLLATTQSGGFVAVPNARTHGPMYGHGFATLFLAEVYGMTGIPEVRDTLRAAIKLIVDTQNADGGWRYQPVRSEADISVTVCQMTALRAARNAGIFVPNETVERCIDYVRRSQNSDGGFSYMLSGGLSGFPRSAAGIVALYSAGIYEGETVERGLQYLEDNLHQETQFKGNNHFFYGQYYAAQAFWHVGEEKWERYYRIIQNTLLPRQSRQGYWPDVICEEYGTAMACIVLQLPNNYLPIFQK